MNKVLIFIFLFLAIIGLIGGIGYTIYCNAYVITIGLLVNGYLAFPEFKKYFNKLLN